MNHKALPENSPKKGELSDERSLAGLARIIERSRAQANGGCDCPTEDEGGCPHCGHAGPKQTTQEHRDRCHRESVGR